MPSVRQRARSPQDKDLRRAQLIEAASRLFAAADFEAITIARVAEVAGMAKGTAYLYFATKETLFLELVRAEMSAWLKAFTKTLNRQRSSRPETTLPAAVARSFAERPQLRRLLVLQHTILEPKIGEAAALDFKLHLREMMDEVTALIAHKMPGWRSEDAQVFAVQVIALVISVTQLSEPPPVIARVLACDPRLKPFRIDFEPFLAQTLATLVRGTRPSTG